MIFFERDVGWARTRSKILRKSLVLNYCDEKLGIYMIDGNGSRDL